MRYSIVIPTFNHLEDCLKPCLESIIQFTDFVDTEVIIVANGCIDGTRAYVESLGHPFKLLWIDEQVGYTKATNVGMKYASGDYVVLLNNDTVLLAQSKNEWLEILRVKLDEDVLNGISGPFLTSRGDLGMKFLIFFCVMIKRSVINSIGYLDEEFGMGYHEDVDYCIRAMNESFFCVKVPGDIPGAYFPIYHLSGASYPENVRKELWDRNDKLLLQRYGNFESTYSNALSKHSDINEHLPTLLKYAQEAAHVTELGMRTGVSTLAFLKAKPKTLISYDLREFGNVGRIAKWAAEQNTKFIFHQKDVLQTDIETTDILLIDTLHEYPQLTAELEKHSAKVRKYIILHDTVTFGEIGEMSRTGPGLWTAVTEFIAKNKEWSIKEHFTNNNGLTVLERIDKPFISVVIPTYNHLEDCLKPCLESIVKFTDLSDVEIIVVANGCTDGTREYVESLGKQFHLIWIDEPYGYTKSTNLGIRAARGEYIVLLNNDTVLLPQDKNSWLDKLLYRFNDPEIGATGPLALHDPYAKERILIFFCVMIRRSVFDHIGLLDEIFSPGGGEDIDFTVRMRKAGYKWLQVPCHDPLSQNHSINVGDFPIYHKGEGTFDEIPEYGLTIIKRNGLVNLKRYVKNIKIKLNAIHPHPDNDHMTVHPSEKQALLKMEYNKLDFEDGQVEEIVAVDIPITEEYIKEWTRVLRDDGQLVTETNGHRRVFPKSQMNQLLSLQSKRKVYDCFCFFNELDILEIRLEELNDVVDFFVLVEMPFTHSGKPKPLYFQQNRSRYAKYLEKIIHITPNDVPDHPDPWVREHFQRDCIDRALTKCSDDDIIIVSDVDEIPRPEAIANYDPSKGLMAFQQTQYSFFINCFAQIETPGYGVSSRIMTYRDLKKFHRVTAVRYEPKLTDETIIKDGGWHLTYLGGAGKIIQKLESFGHQEFNRDEFKDPEKIKDCINSGSEPFGRNYMKFKFCPLDNSFPKSVLEHADELRAKGYIKDDNLQKVSLPTVEVKDPVKFTVAAEISTKNRYDTTLSLAMLSIINQTVKPDKLLIFDDGEHKDIREHPVLGNVLVLCQRMGIAWQVIFGEGKGQVLNHQKAIAIAGTDLIWRFDDDDYAEPDVLEKLLKHMKPGVGAVSGRILLPKCGLFSAANCSTKIEDVYGRPNIQWSDIDHPVEVDHFNNSFLYRVAAAGHGYCMQLSPVGHGEETLFTYGFRKNGWKLILEPSAVIWHLRSDQGGIRSFDNGQLWEHDERITRGILKDWGVNFGEYKIIVLNCGLGDHYAFKMIFPEIKKKYSNHKIQLAVCYPQVFEDEKAVELLSIADAMAMGVNMDAHSIYKWCWDHDWKGRLCDAFRKMYIEGVV